MTVAETDQDHHRCHPTQPETPALWSSPSRRFCASSSTQCPASRAGSGTPDSHRPVSLQLQSGFSIGIAAVGPSAARQSPAEDTCHHRSLPFLLCSHCLSLPRSGQRRPLQRAASSFFSIRRLSRTGQKRGTGHTWTSAWLSAMFTTVTAVEPLVRCLTQADCPHNPRRLGPFGAPGAHCITIRGDQGHRVVGQSMW